MTNIEPNEKGFTLIELIIVMGIIGVLSVVAVVALGAKSKDARNARRLADLAALQSGLALICNAGEPAEITCSPSTENNGEVIISSCVTDNPYLNFAAIQDPQAKVGTKACTDVANVNKCDYGVTLPGPAGSTTFDPCEFTVYSALEQTDSIDPTLDRRELSQKGILPID